MHVVSVNDMKKVYSILLVYHWKYGISSNAREERFGNFNVTFTGIFGICLPCVF